MLESNCIYICDESIETDLTCMLLQMRQIVDEAIDLAYELEDTSVAYKGVVDACWPRGSRCATAMPPSMSLFNLFCLSVMRPCDLMNYKCAMMKCPSGQYADNDICLPLRATVLSNPSKTSFFLH